MVLQKDDENSIDCEKVESRSNADGGGHLRANVGGDKETVKLLGASARRERFGKI